MNSLSWWSRSCLQLSYLPKDTGCTYGGRASSCWCRFLKRASFSPFVRGGRCGPALLGLTESQGIEPLPTTGTLRPNDALLLSAPHTAPEVAADQGGEFSHSKAPGLLMCRTDQRATDSHHHDGISRL